MTAPNPSPGSPGVPSTVNPSALEGAIAGAGLSALNSRTQANVEAAKRSQVAGNSTLTGFSSQVFAGLPQGMSLPLALLNSIGQGLGAIAGAVWNTVTQAVNGLASWIGQFFGAAGKVVGTVVGAISGAVVDGVATVSNWLTALWQAFTGNDNDNSPKTVAQVKSVGGQLYTLAGSASLVAGNAWERAGGADGKAVDAQLASAANASDIAVLKALYTGNDNSGISSYDNYDYVTSSGLDPDKWAWASSGGGYVRSDGVRVLWVDSGSSSGTWLGRYKAASTITSYQVVSTVLDSPIIESPVLGSTQCYNYLIGRSNDSMTSFVYLKIGFDTLSIWKVVPGWQDIIVGETVSYTPKVGDSIQLVLGTTGGIRQFKVLVNNQTRYTVTDSTYYGQKVTNGVVTPGPLSVEDAATNNYGGKAFAAAPRPGGGQTTPGALGIFAIADNAPAPVIGSGIRAYRASTNPATLSTGYNIFPLGWFGQQENPTPDLTFDSQTGRCTVSNTGWYQVVIQQHGDSGLGFGVNCRVRTVLWKGRGTRTRQVVQQGFNRPWNTNTGWHGFHGTFLIYLTAGDWIEPGYWSDGVYADLLSGDTQGQLTWFSVSLVNRSLA